jgi:hypothetical protein
MRTVLGVATAIAVGAVTLAQADPYGGVWIRRPTPDGGTQVLTIKVVDGEEDYTSELTSENGRRQVTHYLAKYDGKDYVGRVTVTVDGETTTHEETVALTNIDRRTRERQSKLNGRTYRILRRVVSADGKVLTSILTEIDAQGRHRTGATLVFDRK